MRKILILIFMCLILEARDNIYFMPQDGNKAQKDISSLILNAHESIDIAMYSFTNKVFFKSLKLAARRGVKIRIVADKDSNKNQRYFSIVPRLKKLRNIKVHLISGKKHGRYKGIMHIKLLIVDDRVVAFGSANYTSSAFHNNYELLYINDDWTFTRRFSRIFNKLWKIR